MVGLTLGLCMVHPTYLSLVDAGEAVKLFGILPLNLAKYTSTVLPVILVVYVASWVQKLAEKLSPKVIRFFFKPLLTLLIMTPLTFCLVGPLGNLVGKGLESVLSVVQNNAPWFLPIFFGAFGPIVIMLGMHYAVTIPLALAAIQAFGYDMLGPGFLVANIAQGGAALAVAFLSKSKDFKSLSLYQRYPGDNGTGALRRKSAAEEAFICVDYRRLRGRNSLRRDRCEADCFWSYGAYVDRYLH